MQLKQEESAISLREEAAVVEAAVRLEAAVAEAAS
jgi:hypothetical protein